MKKRSILWKIFWVIIIFSASLLLFVFGFWGIFVNQPNALYAHIHLAITFVILIVVGSFVVSYLIRKILRPLSVLTDAAEKAGKGNLDQHIEINSKDELGVLAGAFNNMIGELKKMIASREQLLSDVSHELRSPITRARLALEMMPHNSQKESLAGDLKDMEIMITGILESERLRNGTVKANLLPIKVAVLMQKLSNHYLNEIHRISIMPVSDDIVIEADELLMMTVLRNLTDNALKYSPSSSLPIEISVVKQHDGTTDILIEDSGPGIPEEKLPLVFEPFYRADASRSRSTGGYGLGLHLCKRILHLHNAEILLANKKSGGLIVRLKFQTSTNRIPFLIY
jgi:signal transduction histidine kinase